jgi:hypothetical protein
LLTCTSDAAEAGLDISVTPAAAHTTLAAKAMNALTTVLGRIRGTVRDMGSPQCWNG